jgi:UDP-N-acetylmuramoyl-tripeptide--D-alanyl-D-alanine ligase
MQISNLYKLFQEHSSVVTDTRQLKQGDIFFALKGPSFNGNDYALQALQAGAAYAVVDEEVGNNDRLIKVDDVLETLQALAKYHRESFQIPFVAITGSNGKTTTKELIHAVLSKQYKTYTTRGNLNNHIGIPLTLLRIQRDAEMAVIEMGANHQKEIEGYCQYAMPTHGLITNCGKAHLEGFGGVEGVKKGKGELFKYLKETGGSVFVNTDDAAIVDLANGATAALSYGQKEGNIQGKSVPGETFLVVECTMGSEAPFKIKTNMVGDYNLPNVLAAVAVGVYFKVPAEEIKGAIEAYHPTNSRSQLVKQGTNSIILDAYNANPSSMRAAIENFAKLEGDNKIVMLGSMMELGEESAKEHQEIITLLETHPWKDVVLVGKNFNELPHRYFGFESSEEAREWLRNTQVENAHILIKGSRSMQMEKVLS